MSSAVTGRRKARRARFSVIWRAHAGSPVVLGSHTKMRARLDVFEIPVGRNGPAISTPSPRRAMRSSTPGARSGASLPTDSPLVAFLPLPNDTYFAVFSDDAYLLRANGSAAGRTLRGRLRFQEQLGSSLIGYFAVRGLTRDTGAADVSASDEPIADDPGGGLTGLIEPPRLLPGRFAANTNLPEGAEIDLEVAPGALRFFDPDSGVAM